MRRITTLLVTIVTGIAIATISAQAVLASVAVATRESVQHVGGPFIGSYSGNLTQSQAIAKGDVRMTGRFRLVLRRNGTYTVSNPLDGATHGKYAALAGKRLRFYGDSGWVLGGFERPQGGTYRWSLRGRLLTLRVVSEGECTGRTQSLTYPVWKRR